jgi:hypothetical protein
MTTPRAAWKKESLAVLRRVARLFGMLCDAAGGYRFTTMRNIAPCTKTLCRLFSARMPIIEDVPNS